MTLPILLLGFYLGLLALAVGLCSWAGHLSPAPEEARRVTDAAERAGLGHLGAPLRLAGGAVLLFAVFSGTVAIVSELPTLWFLLAPLVAPPVIGAALFYCSRKALKASGQLVGAGSADLRVTLTSRLSVGAVLCCDAAIGLTLLGVYSLAITEMPAEQARFLVFVVGSSIGLAAVVFARAGTSAHFAASEGTGREVDGPHPGSLALLVSSTFHSPLLRLLGLVVLSALGHCALLSLAPNPGEDAGSVWLYPHLLKLLGLFGLLFSGMVVRTSEDESGNEGWLRGAIVYLVLMVAGAWSLSSELPVGWSRHVPAGLSFLYVALGLAVWSARGNSDERPRSVGGHAFLKMPAAVLFVGLLLLLALSTALAEEKSALPSTALLSLLLSGTLAAAPISFVWLLARDLIGGSAQARQLAFVEQVPSTPPRTSPSGRLLVVLPLLALVVALSALSAGLLAEGESDGLALALIGIGAALGALITGALLGQVERACAKTVSSLKALVTEHRASPPDKASLNFEAAVVLCREAIARADLSWLLLCLAPSVAVLLALPLVPPALFGSLALGLGLGAALLGVGLELLLNSDADPARRSVAHLSFVTCITQAHWLLAAGSFPA